MKGGSGQGCLSPQPTRVVWESKVETLSGETSRMEPEEELHFKTERYEKSTA